MSLEVDCRPHGAPIVTPQNGEADKFFHNITLPGPPAPPSEPERNNFKPRKVLIYMIIALVIMTTLAAISAGLAGSYALKRAKLMKECSGAMLDISSSSSARPTPSSSIAADTAGQSHQTTAELSSSASTASANPSTTESSTVTGSTSSSTSILPTASTYSSAADSPSSINSAVLPTESMLVPSFGPIDECSELGSVRNYPQGVGNTSERFKISCNTNYPTKSSLLQIFTYTFGDCINACASYNYNTGLNGHKTCLGVTYCITRKREVHGGNCYFMYEPGVQTVEAYGIDTAIFLPE